MSYIQLPTYEQVVFEDSPLNEVICQLRFNRILKIATAAPVEFQEVIRKQFPVVDNERTVHLGVGGAAPFFAADDEATWQFKTEDDQWIASLTSHFLALKTTAYHDFEHFLEHLTPLIEAFETVYAPSSYARLGLRYVNCILMPRPADTTIDWGTYLNAVLTTAMSAPALHGAIAAENHHFVLLTESGQIGLRFARDAGQLDGQEAERFTLDMDHYATGPIVREQIRDRLVSFNDNLYRLFRWCLTDVGFQFFKPRAKKVDGRS